MDWYSRVLDLLGWSASSEAVASKAGLTTTLEVSRPEQRQYPRVSFETPPRPDRGGSAYSEKDGIYNERQDVIPEDVSQLEALKLSYQKLLRSRNEILQARTEAQNTWHLSVDMRSKSLKSQQGLCDLLSETEAEDLTPEHAKKLRNLSKMVQADFMAVNAQTILTRNTEARLCNLEYRAKEHENKFFKDLTTYLRLMDIWSEAQLDLQWFLEGLNAVSQGSASPTLPPLLEKYYDKAGNVGLLQERLVNLYIDFQEARELRALRTDQGEILSQTDSLFEQEYKTARAATERELGDVIEGAEKAKQECIVQGLDPLMHSISEPSIKLFGGLEAVHQQPTQILATPLLNEPSEMTRKLHQWGQQPLAESLHESGLDSSEPANQRIMHWTSTLTESPPEEPPTGSIDQDSAFAGDHTIKLRPEDVVKLPDFVQDLDSLSFAMIESPRRHSSMSRMLLGTKQHTSASRAVVQSSQETRRASAPAIAEGQPLFMKPY